MISKIHQAADDLQKESKNADELIHKISLFIHEHADSLPEKYEPKSIIESRLTPVDEAFEKGIISCGAVASISAEMLRHLGYKIKLVHGEWDKSVDHAWINVCNKDDGSWKEYDLTIKNEELRPGHKIKLEVDSWEEIRDQIIKDHETIRERRIQKGIPVRMKWPKKFFITGIPTSGKSHLAKKIAEKIGGIVISTDNMRVDILKDSRYIPWINFYLNKDEKEYYTNTSPEDQWKNLVDQSEALWPFIVEKILSFESDKHVIFEGVNILPHLADKDLKFNGIVLIGKSRDDVYERIKMDNRWGNTEELWNFEADEFFNVQRPKYKSEGEKYGYKVYESGDDFDINSL